MNRAQQRLLTDPRPLLMGILNVTPDSFSDGGLHFAPQAALAQAGRLIADGADILDIGGESTRPGSESVAVDEQIARVVPVIQAVRQAYPDQIISIDTTRAAVAAAALQAGADLVNDVSAGLDDADLWPLLAQCDAPYCLMHRLGDSKTMQDNPHYDDVVESVLDFLLERAAAAQAAGIARQRLLIDPGIGFGKRRQDNLDLIAALPRLVASGYPVLLGASRKRFMGALCQIDNPSELMPATVATTALGVMAGVRVLRVHDVRENRQAIEVAWAVRQASIP